MHGGDEAACLEEGLFRRAQRGLAPLTCRPQMGQWACASPRSARPDWPVCPASCDDRAQLSANDLGGAIGQSRARGRLHLHE
jgi:hypothetical protein